MNRLGGVVRTIASHLANVSPVRGSVLFGVGSDYPTTLQEGKDYVLVLGLVYS